MEITKVINSGGKTIIGIISGIGCAAIILGLAWFNILVGDLRFLQIIVNFFVSTPAFLLASQSNYHPIIQGFLFFVYCGLIGGIFGWLFSLKASIAKVVIVLMIVGIITSHTLTQIKIERGLESAMEAIGEAIEKSISGEAHIIESKP